SEEFGDLAAGVAALLRVERAHVERSSWKIPIDRVAVRRAARLRQDIQVARDGERKFVGSKGQEGDLAMEVGPLRWALRESNHEFAVYEVCGGIPALAQERHRRRDDARLALYESPVRARGFHGRLEVASGFEPLSRGFAERSSHRDQHSRNGTTEHV